MRRPYPMAKHADLFEKLQSHPKYIWLEDPFRSEKVINFTTHWRSGAPMVSFCKPIVKCISSTSTFPEKLHSEVRSSFPLIINLFVDASMAKVSFPLSFITESDVLSPGNSFSTFETPYCKIGLGICYDIRFADLAQIYTRDFGCKLLVSNRPR